MSKVFLITGASRGFGQIWAEALLQRGDKVAATSRNLESLNGLREKYGEAVLPLQLNINNRAECTAAVKKTLDAFGRIDVLINNAGFGLFGAVEETTEAQARNQMETNFFGVLWMTQAVLPVMREQTSGHIIQVSSYLGLITLPILGLYNASKFAVEGLSETLAAEVKDFNIYVSLVEPNGYSTDWSGASAVQTQPMVEYSAMKKDFYGKGIPDRYGVPEATVGAILQLIDSPNPPLRLLLGKVAYPEVVEVYKQRLESFEEWKSISIGAHGK